MIDAIAGEDEVSDRQAATVYREGQDELLLIGPSIAGVTLGGIGRPIAFEVGAGQVMEDQRELPVEEVAQAQEERFLDVRSRRGDQIDSPIAVLHLDRLQAMAPQETLQAAIA
jgi:hypothetical protein